MAINEPISQMVNPQVCLLAFAIWLLGSLMSINRLKDKWTYKQDQALRGLLGKLSRPLKFLMEYSWAIAHIRNGYGQHPGQRPVTLKDAWFWSKYRY